MTFSVYVHFYVYILNNSYLYFRKQESHGILYRSLTKPNKSLRDSILRLRTALYMQDKKYKLYVRIYITNSLPHNKYANVRLLPADKFIITNRHHI